MLVCTDFVSLFSNERAVFFIFGESDVNCGKLSQTIGQLITVFLSLPL